MPIIDYDRHKAEARSLRAACIHAEVGCALAWLAHLLGMARRDRPRAAAGPGRGMRRP